MANRKRAIPQYGTVTLNGLDYYRTRVQDADGKLVALYARTPEELYDKELNALEQIDNDTFCRKSPTVAEYCEKWLLMQSVHVRATTMTDYTSKVRRHIIKELGDMRMADVTLDDIQLALVPVSKKSASVYKSVVVLYKSIFRAAKESRIIENNPTVYLTSKGGGVPQKEKEALTDEQAARLLDAIQGLPPYVFVMLGLYAGLRREEILALQWDSVYLDTDTPYLTVRRAWHTESNRPVILDELKTKAAERNIPLPICLADCLREAKANSASEYVVPNRDGIPDFEAKEPKFQEISSEIESAIDVRSSSFISFRMSPRVEFVIAHCRMMVIGNSLSLIKRIGVFPILILLFGYLILFQFERHLKPLIHRLFHLLATCYDLSIAIYNNAKLVFCPEQRVKQLKFSRNITRVETFKRNGECFGNPRYAICLGITSTKLIASQRRFAETA